MTPDLTFWPWLWMWLNPVLGWAAKVAVVIFVIEILTLFFLLICVAWRTEKWLEQRTK